MLYDENDAWFKYKKVFVMQLANNEININTAIFTYTDNYYSETKKIESKNTFSSFATLDMMQTQNWKQLAQSNLHEVKNATALPIAKHRQRRHCMADWFHTAHG